MDYNKVNYQLLPFYYQDEIKSISHQKLYYFLLLIIPKRILFDWPVTGGVPALSTVVRLSFWYSSLALCLFILFWTGANGAKFSFVRYNILTNGIVTL